MKLRSIKNAFFALVGAVMLSQSAQAQEYAAGDLLLGFRSLNVTSYDYVLDLGSTTQFTSLSAGQTITLSFDGNGTGLLNDLNSTFGTSWFTATNSATGQVSTRWSVIGYDSSNNVYASKGEKTPWTTLGSNNDYIITSIQGVANGYNWNGTTANVATGQVQGTGDTGNYASIVSPTSGASFQLLDTSMEGAVSSSLYLYELDYNQNNNASTLLGRFDIDSTSGTVSFSAIPEPSTCALMVLSSFALFRGFGRRRAVKA